MTLLGRTAWAHAIQQYEGFYPGSRAYRNNNPGNFRYPLGSSFMRSLGATGRDQNGFAVFPSAAIGFNALLQFLLTAQQNLLIAYRAYARDRGRPGNMCTLGDFFDVYSPASDGNIPTRYAQWVAAFIGNGVSVDTPISEI